MPHARCGCGVEGLWFKKPKKQPPPAKKNYQQWIPAAKEKGLGGTGLSWCPWCRAHRGVSTSAALPPIRWSQVAALAGLGRTHSILKPSQNVPKKLHMLDREREGRVRQPAAGVSTRQEDAASGVPARQAEIFHLGGVGGCFYTSLPRGEVKTSQLCKM